jgi:O-antigen ligase
LYYSTLTFEKFNENIRPVLYFILMLATYNLVLMGRVRLIIACLVLSSLTLGFFQETSIWSSTTNYYDEGVGYEERVSALGTDPNFTACFIALGVVASVMILFNMLKCPNWLRVFSVFSVLFGISGIIKTSSRGGLVALGLGVATLAFTGRKLHTKLLLLVGVSALITGIAFTVMKSDVFVKRIDAYVEKGDMAGRDIIWGNAWGLIVEAPLLGYGYNRHLFYLGAASGNVMRGTHNTFIAAVLSSGFIGAFFFILFFLRSGWAAFQCRKIFPGNLLFCWFMVCFGMGMSMNAEVAKWFWIILSLCLGARKLQDKQRMLMNVDYGVGNNRGIPVSGNGESTSFR